MSAEPKTYAIVVPVEIRFSLEFFDTPSVAHHRGARMRIFPLRIMGFHMGFVIVAPFEQLSTHFTLVGGFLLRSRFARLSRRINSRSTGYDMQWAGIAAVVQIDRIGRGVCAWPAGVSARIFFRRTHG